jgi:hypothetical protein
VVVVGLTAIEAVVGPVLQLYVVAPDAVTVTGLPEQIVAEFTATVGVVLTVTVAVLIFVQLPVVPVTV